MHRTQIADANLYEPPGILRIRRKILNPDVHGIMSRKALEMLEQKGIRKAAESRKASEPRNIDFPDLLLGTGSSGSSIQRPAL